MFGEKSDKGAGICAYLLDPSVPGWDDTFDGTGPMGFINKTGALLGVGFDNNGEFEDKDHCCIKSADGTLLKKVKVEKGFMTGEEDWRKVHVQFDIKELQCDVKLDGEKIMDDVEFPKDFKIPPKLCVAVCGAATDENFMIAVNDVKLEDEDDENHDLHEEIHVDMDDSGVPKGCTDYKVEDGALVPSEHEEDWRTAGHTKVEYGFELTQDEDNQQGWLLCRVPFEATADVIFASLEYVMEPKAYDEGGGQGLCICILDPSIPGWDRKFDGKGPLGFVGKTGAVLGIGVDCTGTFCEGEPASVAVKRASDGKLIGGPVAIKQTDDGKGVTGVKTGIEDWRKVKVKFDIEEMKVDVKIGGHKYLDDVKIDLGDGKKLPKVVCIGVCAGTADGKTNHICVNDVKLEAEDEDDEDGDAMA